MRAVPLNKEWPARWEEMAEDLAACDWEASPLGAPESWTASLKAVARLVLSAQMPMILFWGPHYVALYNSAFAPTIGDKHPGAFGRPAVENRVEFWSDLVPQLRKVRETGEALHAKDRHFYIERHGYGEDVYFDVSYSPVPEECGTIGGVLCIVSETTERVFAVRRQTFLLNLSDLLRPLGDPAAIKRVTTQVLGEKLHASRCFYAEVDGGECVVESCFHRGVAGLDGRYTMGDYSKVFADRLRAGQIVVSDDTQLDTEVAPSERARNKAGEVAARISVPLVKAGRLVSFVTVHQSVPRTWSAAEVDLIKETAERTWDAVERARAETALRASDTRREAAFDALPVGVGFFDVTGRLLYSNREMRRYMPSGILPSRDKARQWRWTARHPDGSVVEPEEFPGALASRGERVVPGQEMLYTDDEDRTIWTRFAAVPIRDDERQLVGQVAVITDIDAFKRAQETQQLLIGELQHRTRNLLAIVRSIARQTQVTTNSSEEFFVRFHERLAALSRVQALLSRGEGPGADLREMVDGELKAHGASAQDPRVTVRGPYVAISAKMVQGLTLALHELCTNAVKHGALGQDQARLAVSWEVWRGDDPSVLELDWAETGVHLLGQTCQRRGFGRELIERAIPYELNGETCWSVKSDGVHCNLRVPLEAE